MTDLRKLLIEARTYHKHQSYCDQIPNGINGDCPCGLILHRARIDAALAEAVALHFLDRDNDGHWYVVQESKRKEWEKWLQIPSDDQASWEVPVFASPVGGAPNTIQFYIAAPADQWRRVEDVPLNEWVLVTNGKWRGVAMKLPMDDSSVTEQSEQWQNEHREFVEQLGPKITKWMPIPALPEGE